MKAIFTFQNLHMKKTWLILILIVFNFTQAFSQSLSGKLIDKTNNEPIKNAVVMLMHAADSVLYKFTRTAENGSFSIKPVNPGTYFILTTHPIFGDYSDSLNITNDTSLGTVNILPKAKLLEEVIVKSGSPIRIKGDTIIYTADSFKVKEGANVEDLLRILPGIQVGKNGEIKAMGEKTQLLVDGEEFFGNDPGIITKNLQANAVQEVQVYDKKSDQAAFTGIDDGQTQKTINLKLKANRKRGYFGKMEAGGGTPDNYNNSAMLNAFLGKRKFSAFGIMSNTGKTQLGWDEAERFGGGEREGMTTGVDELSGGMWMSWNNDDEFGNGSGGIPKNWNGGLHYSNKYKGDSLSINGSYRYSKINAPGGSNTFSQVYLPDSNWSSNSNSTIFSTRQKHNMSFTIETKIDSNNTIKFTNKGSVTDNNGFSNFYEESNTVTGGSINNSTRKNISATEGLTYNGVLTWNHKFNKPRRTLSLTAMADISDNKSNINLLSLNNYYKGTSIIRKDTVDQNTATDAASQTFTGSMAFTEPIDKYLSVGINFSANASLSNNNRNVFTKDLAGKYSVKTDSLSNNFDFDRQQYKPGFVFRLVKKKITAMVGSSVSFNKFIQKNISKGLRQDYQFNNFFPIASFSAKLKGNKSIRLNYNGNAQAPTLQQLQPVADNSNPLNIFTGNNDLKQSFTNNFNATLNWSKPLSDNSVWIWSSYRFTNNAFVQFNSIDTLGRNVYKTVNTNGNQSFSLDADFNFPIGKGKKKFNAGINPSVEVNRTIDFINGLRNISNSRTYSMRLSVNKYKEDKFDFYAGPSINYSKSTSSINPQSSTSFWSFSGWADVNVYIKQKTQIGANGNFNWRQKDPRFAQNNNYTTLNASVKQFLYKKELAIKLSVNDILNQNRGYNRSFSTYKFTESYYRTLRRYWLLSVIWEFNHQKKIKTDEK